MDEGGTKIGWTAHTGAVTSGAIECGGWKVQARSVVF